MKKSFLTTLTILFLCETTFAYNFSGIDIVNLVGQYPSTHYDAIHANPNLWVVSDGLDNHDIVIEDDFCENAYWGGGFVYSEVEGRKCLYDWRPCDSNVPFQLKLFFCGEVANEKNCLWVDFYVDKHNETFGDKSIVLESDRLLYGFAVDVRRIIEIGCPYGGGLIQLIPVPAGNYGIDNPYGSAVLHIGTRFLEDVTGDDVVDLRDFAVLAADWDKPQGKYRGDISGADGIPDGIVNYYDLATLVEQGWLANSQ